MYSLNTASPSMRGSTPLDVAAASVMDNNELSLELQEPDLEKVNYIIYGSISHSMIFIQEHFESINLNI